MAYKHILDRLADAGEAEKGMRLSARDVHDLLWEVSELELALELEAAMIPNYIRDKASPMCESPKRQAGVGNQGIEVTPEMIEAGLVAVTPFSELSGEIPAGSVRLAVEMAIRAAMLLARNVPQGSATTVRLIWPGLRFR